MFSNNFVVSIKHNGEILREFKDVVYLPFGSEYSILLKNLHITRAVVSVSVDGDDVLDDNRIVISAGDTHELKGFMRGSTVRNRFKFIEKTKRISDYRGNKVNDGIIRVIYQYESLPIVTPIYKTYDYYYDHQYSFDVTCRATKSINEDGITVKGSPVSEKYSDTSVGYLESENVLTLKLKGNVKQHITKPTLVKEKIGCPTCGLKNNSRNKYCYECGTYLIN